VRHRRASEHREVRCEDGRDGMGWLTAYLPVAELRAIDSRLNDIARISANEPGESRTLAQLRVDIFRDLLIDAPVDLAGNELTNAVDTSRFRGIRPTVMVTVPVLTLLGRGEEPATLEGYGPIDDET